ncbi:phosphoribosyl-ATP diphosphatase [Magnetospira sp. QH-2]|uniref:phosphoribosyl-ATP diphosphatase n=1 Tax=Magnetospira sp. (strain QH-2) TaxID=1288970 RepID=UPI0003E81130|nr:phosphoribosyl-ATP diphosphatase [Magnetospira sp. QH-2]CCQ75644.1 Phosphoribosyl-ATP pyrophosphatase [Magnetospira sp. QH-2]
MSKKTTASPKVLEELHKVIVKRKGDDPKTSYTAKLFHRGRGKICQKLGEEAVEVVVAALDESPDNVASESADLLYHLLVLWADKGVDPQDVWAELAHRRGTSGIEEKKSRKTA